MTFNPPLLTKEERVTLSTSDANKLYLERRRERLVQLGVCCTCGKHPPAEGKTSCRFCISKGLERSANSKAKRYQKLSIVGMCIRCGTKLAQPGKARCVSCAAADQPKDKQRQAARRDRFKEQGLCIQCGVRPPREGMTRCQPCAKRTSETGKVWRDNAKQKAVDYLGGACKDCGLKTDILAVYDFHHRDQTEKDFTIAKFITTDFDLVVAPELDKCDLLCANCHRIRHATNPSFEELQDEEGAA